MRSSLSSIIYSAIAITSVVAFTPSPIIQQQHHSSSLLKAVATETVTGTVKWYNRERGFGFIEQDDGGPDMYVHATGLTFEGTLLDNDRVSFTTEIDKRTNKPKAVNVARTDDAAPATTEVETEPAAESMVEKVMDIVKNELSDDEKKERAIKAEAFQRARLAAQLAMPKPEPPAAAVSEASVDYDATVRLAYDAAGSSGDFDAFKATYLADTSAMVGQKYKDAAAKDVAAAEKKAAEARAKKEAEEKAAAEAKAAEEAAAKKAAEEAEAKALEEALRAKSPEVLAAKYAAMDLEERAFTILCDLGMIELHPDPDDPNRDTSRDDEEI